MWVKYSDGTNNWQYCMALGAKDTKIFPAFLHCSVLLSFKLILSALWLGVCMSFSLHHCACKVEWTTNDQSERRSLSLLLSFFTHLLTTYSISNFVLSAITTLCIRYCHECKAKEASLCKISNVQHFQRRRKNNIVFWKKEDYITTEKWPFPSEIKVFIIGFPYTWQECLLNGDAV